MARRPKRTRRRATSSPPWVKALTLEPEPLDVPRSGDEPATDAAHRFRVLRPQDLVVLEVLAFGLELESDGDGVPTLRPAASGARLEVRYTFQHLLEQAEPEMENPPPPAPVPIEARATFGSRLVFAVPEGERIGYDIEGVLSAMSRLELMVAPLAKPRVLPRIFRPSLLGHLVTVAELPGGLRLVRSDAGLVLAPRQAAAARGAGASAIGAAGLIAAAQGLRAARVVLASERAINLSRVDIVGKGGLGDMVVKPGAVRWRRLRPRAPNTRETAIEAPFRLILSPSRLGGFAHATTPRVVAPAADRAGDPERVELWHSRLGVRQVDADGVVSVSEASDPQKAVRAIWTRDMDEPAPGVIQFIASLLQKHRESIVRQSADPRIAPPQPVDADRLYLSALGAWLELHGRWDPAPFADQGLDSLVAWDHEAASGRDNFVRTVEPYCLFPFGHRCNLVTITERKMKEPIGPQARLYQRKFVAVQEPVRTFDDPTMPFRQVRLRPLVTPNLDFDLSQTPPIVGGTVQNAALAIVGERLFWPLVGGDKYRFVLDCLDHDHRRVVMRTPLLAVSASLGTPAQKPFIAGIYGGAPERPIAGDGQMIAMAPSGKPGDTAFEAVTLRFVGDAGDPGSQTATPHLEDADIVVPAMKHLAPVSGPVTVSYDGHYLAEGFEGANASAQVLFKLASMTSISFGGGTDEAGGFVQPDLPVRGLSRAIGVVGDIDSVVSPDKPFDPTKFLFGPGVVFPKLFGLFDLEEILASAGLDKAPTFITDQLDQIAALLADLEALSGAIDDAVARLASDAAAAPTTALKNRAEQARTAIQAVQASFATTLQGLHGTIDALLALDAPSDLPAVAASVGDLLDDLAGFVSTLQDIARTLPLPPKAKADLERLTGALAPLLAASRIASTIEAIAAFVNGLDPSGLAVRARFEWRPKLKNFPDGPAQAALFFVPEDGFVLSVEARASGSDGVGADVLAELRDFGLNLFPGAPLLRIEFDRLAFRAASGRKPEVDVVFNGMKWQGILGFIETLQKMIPFDGFSDPPYVDVSVDGLTAGFDLGLPAVAVGVFSLENISLGADVRVPFLGDALTVGFYFCTREKPFRLTVMAIGGGGFVGLRLSPKGLVMLEMALEAGACLSVNLGVASGSVSVMVGIYMKLEANEGQLTGYFRIRGQVDVLGLISASITLELSLTYEFETGKMVGRASIQIEVEVFMFSFSVTVSCERRLAGSKGDPTLAQILGVPDDGKPLTDVPDAWADYCAAFAAA